MKINPVSPQAAAHRPASQSAAGSESGDAETTVNPAFTVSLSDHADKVLKGGSEAAAGSTARRAAQMIHDDPGAFVDYKNFGQVVASLVRNDAAESEAAAATTETGDTGETGETGAVEDTGAPSASEETAVIEDPIDPEASTDATGTTDTAPAEADTPADGEVAGGDPTDLVPEITVDTTGNDVVDLIDESTNDPEAV